MARMVKYDFNPFVESPLRGRRRQLARAEIKRFLEGAVQIYISSLVSPVSGQGRYRGLSTRYTQRKISLGGSAVPNLRLRGAMRAAIRVSNSPEGGVRVHVLSSQAKKAAGHNHWNGRHPTLLRRAFIPNELKGETWKASILAGVRAIVKKWESGQEREETELKTRFEQVEE